jgi:hypothetical protein
MSSENINNLLRTVVGTANIKTGEGGDPLAPDMTEKNEV